MERSETTTEDGGQVRAMAFGGLVFAAVFSNGLNLAPRIFDARQPADQPDWSLVRAASYYPDCAAARADGVPAIPLGAPAYRRALDPDGDGTACGPGDGAPPGAAPPV